MSKKKPWFVKKPKPQHNISLLSDKFETLNDAKKELKYRIKCLKNSGLKKDLELAKWIGACRTSKPCGSGACSICMRNYRIWLVGHMLRIFSEYNDTYYVTLIIMDRYMEIDNLSSISVKKAKDRLRTQLRRCGLGSAVIVGGFESDLDFEDNLWIPHFHLIVANANRSKLEKLRKKFYKGNRAMNIMESDDSASLYSYILKSYFKYRKSSNNKIRIGDKEQIAVLHFLSKLGLHERAFLLGLKRSGRKIVKSSVVL